MLIFIKVVCFQSSRCQPLGRGAWPWRSASRDQALVRGQMGVRSNGGQVCPLDTFDLFTGDKKESVKWADLTPILRCGVVPVDEVVDPDHVEAPAGQWGEEIRPGAVIRAVLFLRASP